jgi:hypothetical protein
MKHIFSILAVIVFGWMWVANDKKAKASNNWPSVYGVIEASAVDTRYSDTMLTTTPQQTCKSRSYISTRSSSSRRNKSWHYDFKVRYRYSVNGRNYQNGRYCFCARYSSITSYPIDALVDRYPRGKEVLVYYNPQQPSESTLLRGKD